MRYDDLYLSGLGSYLPHGVSVDDAVAAGKYEPEDQESSGQQAVAVAGPGDTQPQMAAAAGRVALDRSGYRGADVALLLHAVTTYNGLEAWNVGCYLQNEVLGGAGLSFEIRQLSNGAVASIELAAAYLAADPGRTAAMITAADQFAEPAWDRWNATWGLVYADGASAAVLSRAGGFARVLSAVTITSPELEGLHRGSLSFGASPDTRDYPIDFKARALDYGQTANLEEVGRTMAASLVRAASTASAEADIDVADIEHYVVPSFGKELLQRECLAPLGIDIERSTWGWGKNVGHAGAADQFASLTYLSEADKLAPGERVMIVGVGGGFNWTCAVLEVTERPAWAY
jgi:3-oxoacyl-[acyl-carrier-protein] synthase-3